MPWFYYFGRGLVRLTLFLLTHWQVKGKENVYHQGPLLVVSNHLNLADPPVIAVSIGRKAMFMAKEELFRSGLSGYFIRGFGAFPVHRGQADRKALRQAQEVLDRGMVLIMFPEGSRSKNARLQQGLDGSAMVALRSDVPILPIGITGTEKVGHSSWWLRRPQITVNIGVPFHLSKADSKVPRSELAEATHVIMKHIAELLPLEYRGNYSKHGKSDNTED